MKTPWLQRTGRVAGEMFLTGHSGGRAVGSCSRRANIATARTRPKPCATTSFLAPSNVRAEANSDGEGNPVCSPHGITTDQRGVLPSLPWYDTAGHATEPIGLFPHL